MPGVRKQPQLGCEQIRQRSPPPLTACDRCTVFDDTKFRRVNDTIERGQTFTPDLLDIIRGDPEPALCYAALTGNDDIAWLILANVMGDNAKNNPAVLKAAELAMAATKTQGHGGHTLLGVYLRSVYSGDIHQSIPLNGVQFVPSWWHSTLKIQEPEDWIKQFVDTNDHHALTAYLKARTAEKLSDPNLHQALTAYLMEAQPHETLTHALAAYVKTLTGQQSDPKLHNALGYASERGDDIAIQILVQNGAEVQNDHVNAAKQQNDTAGVGGHTLAAAYLEGLQNGTIDPYTSLSNLKCIKKG